MDLNSYWQKLPHASIGNRVHNGLLNLFCFWFHPLLVGLSLALPLKSKLVSTVHTLHVVVVHTTQTAKMTTMTPSIVIGPPYPWRQYKPWDMNADHPRYEDGETFFWVGHLPYKIGHQIKFWVPLPLKYKNEYQGPPRPFLGWRSTIYRFCSFWISKAIYQFRHSI